MFKQVLNQLQVIVISWLETCKKHKELINTIEYKVDKTQ